MPSFGHSSLLSSSSSSSSSFGKTTSNAPGDGRHSGADRLRKVASAVAKVTRSVDPGNGTQNNTACAGGGGIVDAATQERPGVQTAGIRTAGATLSPDVATDGANAACNMLGAGEKSVGAEEESILAPHHRRSDLYITPSDQGDSNVNHHDHPHYSPQSDPIFSWGRYDGATFCEIVNAAYDEAVHWRRNIFKIPSGKCGKDFTRELARLYASYGQASSLESIALKAAMVMPLLLLQKSSRASKAKDHVCCLERRMRLWFDGEIESLLQEGRVIQNHFRAFRKCNIDNDNQTARKFANLMFEGKTNAALRLLSTDDCRGALLSLDKVIGDIDADQSPQTVRDVLRAKHPSARSLNEAAILKIEPGAHLPTTHPVLFEGITADSIKAAALRSQGAAGPSGLDGAAWQRLCSSFKGASVDLCAALASVARRISTECVDPRGLSAFVASRLIALDKCPGVRPIGIGEVSRRIIGKAILQVVGNDVREVTGARQLCAGQQAGVEAAVHAVRQLFSGDESRGVLLVDAANAFNNINRQVALHNIRQLCPSIATALTNTYRTKTALFIDGEVLYSEEGTTQGDPLSMAFYALATIPLADACRVNGLDDVWFADDASGSADFNVLRQWWNNLCEIGPLYGYYPNSEKTWLIVHDSHVKEAETVFANTRVQISTEGRRELGAPIGNRAFVESYVTRRVERWKVELDRLCDVARSQPHAAYSAFCLGLRGKWLSLMRTVPNISSLLMPLEDKIRKKFLPIITRQPVPNDTVRALLALPARLGGMSVTNLVTTADAEYDASTRLTAPLVALIVARERTVRGCQEQQTILKKEIQSAKRKRENEMAKTVIEELPDTLQRSVHLAQEKGASSWLTVRPLQQHGFTLHKSAFYDAVGLRYNWPLPNLPEKCVCGSGFSADHAMSCPAGGFPSMRHNEIRDVLGALVSEVATVATIEPTLQPLTGETFVRRTTTQDDDARLDIYARGFWGGRSEDAFFDVRILNPNAPSYRCLKPSSCYNRAEKEKDRKYGDRVRQVEHASFTPLIFSVTGGTSKLTTAFLKRLAARLSEKRDTPYSVMMAWLRCRLGFSLLRSAILCLRGSRHSARRHVLDDDMEPCLAVHQSGLSQN